MAGTSAPHFVRNISTRTTCRSGSTASLDAMVSGRPRPLVTWHKNGVPVVKGGRRHISYDESGRCRLVIVHANDEDEGEFECRAKNILGQVSCFGELYVSGTGVQTRSSDYSKRATSPLTDDSAHDESEGKSGLFILIDEGSQDEENSDELGHRESISASEQIESIIEDLTLADGSLSLSIGKEGAFVSELDTQEDLPLDRDGKLFKSKVASRHMFDGFLEEDVFADADESDYSAKQLNTERKIPSTKREARSTSFTLNREHNQDTRSTSFCSTEPKQKPPLLNLHKVAGEENLNLVCNYANDADDDDDFSGVQDFEVARTANIGGRHFNDPPKFDIRMNKTLSEEGEEDCMTDGRVPIEHPEASLSARHRKANVYSSDFEGLECPVMPTDAPPVSLRRNTTNGEEIESCTCVKTKKVIRRQRSNSDGKLPGKVVEVDDGVDEECLSQTCPWESLEKIWHDSAITESDQLPSDAEISNDDVFGLDRSAKFDSFSNRANGPMDIANDTQFDDCTWKPSRNKATMSFSRSIQSYSYKKTEGYAEESVAYSRVSSSTVGGESRNVTQARSVVSYTGAYDDTDDSRSEPIIEQYVVISDFTPDETDVGSIALREGQIVEVLEQSKHRWLVRTRPSKYLSPRQGWIPFSYLEKKVVDTTIHSLQSIGDLEFDLRSDSKEREAAQKRRIVVKELVETEEEFVKDMQHVVNTYLKEMDNPRMPKELRDQRDAIFLNFKEICDFHNNVLIKGVQYYAGEPTKLGKTFVRLERDFDMHSNYCQDEAQAQAVLATPQVKEYVEEYSKRIGEIDRSLSDHLKLPIQRINDYQLLIKELIKYSSILGEDCTDLQKALDLMLGIPQRATDLKYINNIHGFKGNIHKLGRLLRHQDWFVVTDADGRKKERYLFLFKSRIFVTKVKKLSEARNTFILKDIIKLADVEIRSIVDNSKAFQLHHRDKERHPRYPLCLEAATEEVKEAWAKDIGEVATDTAITDPIEEEVQIERLPELEKDADEEQNTVMTDSIRSNSVASLEANEFEDGTQKPRFRKYLKGTTCIHGDMATLECELMAVPSATVAWLKDNVPLTESDRVKFITEDNSHYLVINGTVSEDSGLYTCKGSNQNGTASCSSHLNVQEFGEKRHDRPLTPGPKAPEFTINFKNTDLAEGTSVRFLIKVRANPDADIKFFKNGRPLKEDDRVKILSEDSNTLELCISHVTKHDAGNYSCVAKNSFGESSMSADVTVSADKDVFQGVEQGASKGKLLKPGEQPDFRWFRDGHEVETSERFKVLFKDEEDTLALVFQHVKPEDAGLYTCVASTSSGRIACSAELTVQGTVNQLLREPEAPKITAELTDTEVSQGASAMLDLKVTGFPKPKITWIKDGVEVTAGGRIKFLREDEESISLVIKNVTYEDAGKYTVKAKNDLGEVSTCGNLIVRAPPKFNKQMKDMAVMTDDPVRFEVEVEGKPAPEITWYKDGQMIKETERVKIVKEKGDVCALVIKKVVVDDAGSYSCVASNTSGKMSEFSNLTVNDPPRFLKGLKSLDVKEDETIKFEVKVSGHPAPTVKWTKDGTAIKDDGKHVRIEHDDRVHTLTINKVTRTDAGKFTCEISSDSGSATECGDLTVNSSPNFVRKLSDLTVKEGDSDVRLEVKVSGFPHPKIKWFIESLEIIETSKKFKCVDNDETHVLIIKKVDEECSGSYSCKITNDYGEESCMATVKVLTKPKFVETLKDVEVNETEDVIYNVKFTGNPTPTAKWYKENQEVNVTANIKITKPSEDGSCSLTLKTVTDESAGNYECRVTNSEGEAVTISKLVVYKDTKVEEENIEATVYKLKDVTGESDNIRVEEEEDNWNKESSREEHTESESQFVDVFRKTSDEDSVVVNKKKDKRKKGVTVQSYSMSSVKQSSSSYIIANGATKMIAEYSSSSSETVIEESGESGTKTEKRREHNFESVSDTEELKFSIKEIDSDSEFGSKCGHDESKGDLERSLSVTKGVVEEAVSDQEETFLIKQNRAESMEQNNFSIVEVVDDDHAIMTPDEYVTRDIKKFLPMERSDSRNEAQDEVNKDGHQSQQHIDEIMTSTDKSSSVEQRNLQNVEQRNLQNVEQRNLQNGVDDKAFDDKAVHKPDLQAEAMSHFGSVSPEEDAKGQESTTPENTQLSRTSVNTQEVDDKTFQDDVGEFGDKLAHPKFESGFKNLDVWNGEDAILTTVGTGIPTPDVQWYKDGEELDDDKRIKFENDGKVHRVHIHGSVPEDSGVYKCELKNKLGKATEEGTLNVKTALEANAPVLLKKLESAVLIEGHPVTFEAKIYANPDPDIKWYKDGKELTDEANHVEFRENAIKHSYSLTIKNTTPKDIGQYSVKASNSHGEITSEASLDVQVPPVIQEIRDKKTMPKSSVSFETTVTGKPQPTVKWTRESKDLIAGDNVKFESDAVTGVHKLHLHDVSPNDGGEYACIAQNAAGECSLPFKLTVTTEAPRFIKGLHDIIGKLKNPIKLDVQVYGLPMPTVKWFKGEEEVTDGWKVKLSQEDDRNFSLTIEQLGEEDAGKYTCKAINNAGEALSHGQITLHCGLPEFHKSLLKEVCIIDGEPFCLEAKLDNNPMPQTKWLKDGKEVKPDEHVMISSLPDGTVQLKVENADPEDRGKYTLVATTDGGEKSSTSHVAVDAVPKPPTFLKKLQSTDVNQGEKLKLEAKVTAHPRPSAKWLKDGKPVKLDSRTQFFEAPGGRYALEIDNVKLEDEGKYSLHLSNHQGESSSDANVSVLTTGKTPEFLQPLKPVTAIDGLPSRLEAKVNGAPLPQIKWYKDGVPFVPDDMRVKSVLRPDGTVALLFDKTLPEDAGKYTCEATNPLGSTKADGDLTVSGRDVSDERKKAPSFVTPLRDIQVDEGKPFKLFAQIEGNPFPEISWTKDGVPIKMTDNLSHYCDGNKLCLEVRKATPKDAGVYDCHLSNSEGKAHKKANVGVNKLFAPASFTQRFTDAFTIVGGDPRFVCRVSGIPKPDIVWYFNDVPLQDSGRYKMKRDGDMCALQIKGAALADLGQYTCKATNEAGADACSAKLDVGQNGERREKVEPPSFLKKIGDCSPIEGMAAKFTACITGIPEPDFKWFKDGKEITGSNHITIQVEPHGLLRLVIDNAQRDDVGKYSLRISNPHGEAECAAQLVFDTYEDKLPRELSKPKSRLDDRDKPKSTLDDDREEPRDKLDDREKPRSRLDDREKPRSRLDDREKPSSDTNDTQRDRNDDRGKRRELNGDYSRPTGNIHDDRNKPLDLNGDHGKARDRYHGDGRDPHRDMNNDIDRPKDRHHGAGDPHRHLNNDYGKPRDKMADLNIGHDKFRRSAIPLALPDKPIISKMTDRRLTLSWKPSIPIGPSVPVTYIVDMCELPHGEFFHARSGIRGCCCEIRNLEPFRDYKFRVRVENKYGISDPSPFATAYRTKLEMTPPKQLPKLPPELDFRPETSPYFPKDYDIDRPLHEEYAHEPRFMRHQDVQYGVKGQSTSVEWWVYGYPTPDASFNFNDTKIEVLGRYEYAVARNGQCKLYLNRMLDRDVGVYECVAVNVHGEARQRVRLEIAEHPVFIMPLEEETLMNRRSGSLQCRVVGVPYPDIKWYKDWHPIVSSDRIKIEWREPDLCTLTINGVISKDGGLYSCAARNIAGVATSSAMLYVEEDENDYGFIKYDHSRVIRAHPRPMEETYDIGDELGRGTQSIVYHAVERSTGNSYAAKTMYGKGDVRGYMRHELDIMNQLHDRYLIRARDAYETKNFLSLITELASGGELFDTICKQSSITESEVAHYIRQVLWGLDHMHSKGIAHLGLSPGDLLIARPGGDDIKICDFGLANRIIKGKDLFLEYGMPEFVAPEISNHKPVSFGTDMWSVGVITYILLSGISPFLGDNDRETLRRIQKGHITFDSDIFKTISDEGKDFISKLLVFDASGRIDVKSALRHPWLKFADRLGVGDPLPTDRLRNYYEKYRDWMNNSACKRYYRRRPLSSAFEDPSCMVYPPGDKYTPPDSPGATQHSRDKPKFDGPAHTDRVERDHEAMDYDLGYVDSTSHYQNGPDTYLLQLRDVGLPLRLREYMRVSACASPSLALRLNDTITGKAVSVRERRRFTDVMDEEIDDEKKGELNGLRRRIHSEVSPRSETRNRIKELLPHSHENEISPYFREKLLDTALVDEQPIELSCLAIGEPKPVITWYRNDILMSESQRVKVVHDAHGRCILKFLPAKNFDAGVYKAVARNPAGETTCRARLKQGVTPGRPDAPEISQVSDTEVLVTWHPPKADGNSAVVCYSLEYKEIEEASWHEVANNIVHMFMVVRTLEASTKYQFRVRALNGFGWGEHSGPSAIAETKEAGAPKVPISRALKYQQEMTEGGQTIDLTRRRISLDYSIEQNPVPVSIGTPTEKYNFLSEISRGRYSVVVKCCQRAGEGQVFAAKLLEYTSSARQSAVQNEYDIYKTLRHERIPFLHEAYHYDGFFVFIQEKLQGCDILTYLIRNHEYSEDAVAKCMSQVLDALEYLHFRGIAYLDVQPDNVVMSDLSSCQVKLVDFGNARYVDRYDPPKAQMVGLLEYVAPEVLNQEDLTVQADVWGVGVLTLSGVSPFRGESQQETAENITYVRYRFEHLYKDVTPEATRFLMLIFKRTPQKRPTVDECLETCKWLNPSELMLKKRERTVFLSNRLKQFAEEYHTQRLNLATTSESLLNAFGMQFSRSNSVQYDTMTTF